jgi:hypothetical protein
MTARPTDEEIADIRRRAGLGIDFGAANEFALAEYVLRLLAQLEAVQKADKAWLKIYIRVQDNPAPFPEGMETTAEGRQSFLETRDPDAWDAAAVRDLDRALAEVARLTAALAEANTARWQAETRLAVSEQRAREAERDRLQTDVEASARHANALSERARSAEAERDRLTQERRWFFAKLTDLHDVPPEHFTEPLLFHRGWELAIRRIRAALSDPSGEQP